MKKWIIAVLIAIVVVALIGIGLFKFSVGRYNTLVAKGQDVDKSWGQVENVLQRRNDLIPNLVNIVQAYAIHEQEVFIKVAEARALWNKAVQGGSISDKMSADNAVRGSLLNLMAIVENYPELKANENFLALQDELAGTENRIAVERMRYNESVQDYNTFAKMFPTNIIVKAFSFPKERDYFQAVNGAGQAPQIKITYPGVPVPGVTPPAITQPTPPIAQPAQGPTIPKVIAAPTITPPAEQPAVQPGPSTVQPVQPNQPIPQTNPPAVTTEQVNPTNPTQPLTTPPAPGPTTVQPVTAPNPPTVATPQPLPAPTSAIPTPSPAPGTVAPPAAPTAQPVGQ